MSDPEVDRILRRFEAALAFIYPDDMTPTAKRIFERIIEDERGH